MDSYNVQAILTLKDNMSAGMRAAAGSTESLGKRFRRAIGLGSAMQIGMSAVSATMRTVGAHVGDAVSRVDQLRQFPRIMSNLGVSGKDAKSAVKALDKGIQGLPTTLDAATRGVTRFTSKNNNVKKSTKYFLAMNNAVIAGGQSTEIQSSAVEQLSQAYAKGKMDMIEWRSLQTAMPAQLNQIAKAMGMTTDQLGEGLRNGTVSMDDFMDTMVKLNKEGTDGLASFEAQAQTAVGGIGNSFKLMGLAITRGLADSIVAIDTMLENNNLPTIAEMFTKAKEKIDAAFKGIAAGIKRIKLKEFIQGLTPAIELFKNVLSGAGNIFKKVAKFANKNATAIGSLIPVAFAGVLIFKAYKKLEKWLVPLENAGKTFKKTEESTKKGSRGVNVLKKSLAGLAKMAGVAMMVASLALLAKTMTGLGKLGADAVAPMLTFGAVVASLVAIFSQVGTKLQTSAVGIGVFAGSLSVLALTMGPIANAGANAAKNMAVFGVVVAGLAAVFAIFGTALNAALPGLAIFSVAVLATGAALRLAAPFVTAMSRFVRTLGDVIVDVAGAAIPLIQTMGRTICSVMSTAGSVVSQVAGAISNGFLRICQGVTIVINAISGGLTDVLDSVSGIIDSIGTAARNAGTGFLAMAVGIKMVTDLNLFDMGASLGAVALGIGGITAAGAGLGLVSGGMLILGAGIMMVTAKMSSFNASTVKLSSSATKASSGISRLKKAFAGFKVTPPKVGAFNAALRSIGTGSRQAANAVRSSCRSMISALGPLAGRFRSAGTSAGRGFSSGIKSGMRQAVTAARSATNSINNTLRAGASGARTSGLMIGRGLANGLRSALPEVRSAAAQLAKAADKAIQKKAEIGSPSRVARREGNWFGKGWALGISDMAREAKTAAAQLFSIPSFSQPSFAMAAGAGDYSFGGGSYTIEVPVNIDGREVSRVTAAYMQDDLDRLDRRNERKRGRV